MRNEEDKKEWWRGERKWDRCRERERESQTQRNDGARERDVNGDKRDDKAGGRIKLFILGPTFIFSYIKYLSSPILLIDILRS